MSASLSFNLFVNVLHKKQTNQTRILNSPMELFVTMDDGGLCMLLSSVSVIKLEAWSRAKTQRTQAFHILVPFFFSRYEEYNLLLPLPRKGCSLIDPFVFWRFYKVLFESIAIF